ncbi:hypothetical protein EGW08_003385, partial [Elysia chlorotica]
SSTFDYWYASRAVDGYTVQDRDAEVTCSHTADRQNGYWKLAFRNPVHLYRILLYNRDDYQYRLRGFTLQLLDGVTSVFSYTDRDQRTRDIYTIIPPANPPPVASLLSVSQGTDSRFVTLCEVVALGETVCPAGQFGRECERRCNCVDRSERCFVHSGGCPSG